jgi:hypothetical protein
VNKTVKAIATAALAAATVIGTSAKAVNVDDAHYELGMTIASTGIDLKINPVECFEGEAMGWYWARKNELVICQQNAFRPGTEVQWTAEDFDTLRHEAQHLIQDCVDGARQGALDSVYQEPIRLGKEVLGNSAMQRIAKAYSDQSDHVIVMEIEAFAVAALNNPADQTKDIKNFCF